MKQTKLPLDQALDAALSVVPPTDGMKDSFEDLAAQFKIPLNKIEDEYLALNLYAVSLAASGAWGEEIGLVGLLERMRRKLATSDPKVWALLKRRCGEYAHSATGARAKTHNIPYAIGWHFGTCCGCEGDLALVMVGAKIFTTNTIASGKFLKTIRIDSGTSTGSRSRDKSGSEKTSLLNKLLSRLGLNH